MQRGGAVRASVAMIAELLYADLAVERKCKSGCFEFSDQEIGPDLLRFHSRVTTPDGREEELRRRQVRGRREPFQARTTMGLQRPARGRDPTALFSERRAAWRRPAASTWSRRGASSRSSKKRFDDIAEPLKERHADIAARGDEAPAPQRRRDRRAGLTKSRRSWSRTAPSASPMNPPPTPPPTSTLSKIYDNHTCRTHRAHHRSDRRRTQRPHARFAHRRHADRALGACASATSTWPQKTCPREHKGAIRWLDDHARRKNLTLREVAALLKDAKGQPYSESTVYKAMTGRHEAKLDNFVRAIEHYRKPFTERPAEEKIPYVATSLSTSIQAYVEKCKKYGRMGLVFGRNQWGKSTAYEQLAISQPFGQVQVYRVPTNGTSAISSRQCAGRRRSRSPTTRRSRKEKLIESFDRSMTIILDDMQECYEGNRPPRLDTFRFGMEIYDRTGATVIESATPIIHNKMIEGRDATAFERITHRSLPAYILSEQLPALGPQCVCRHPRAGAGRWPGADAAD